MFLGLFSLGGRVKGSYILTKTGDAPTAADALPTYRIYGPTGLMTNGTGTTVAGDQTGLYKIDHELLSGDGFAVGSSYSILVSYAISAASKAQLLTFQVY